MTSYLLPKVTWQTPNPFCQFTFWTFWPFANLPQWPFTIECCGILTSTGSCQLHAYFRGHSRPRPQFEALSQYPFAHSPFGIKSLCSKVGLWIFGLVSGRVGPRPNYEVEFRAGFTFMSKCDLLVPAGFSFGQPSRALARFKNFGLGYPKTSKKRLGLRLDPSLLFICLGILDALKYIKEKFFESPEFFIIKITAFCIKDKIKTFIKKK